MKDTLGTSSYRWLSIPLKPASCSSGLHWEDRTRGAHRQPCLWLKEVLVTVFSGKEPLKWLDISLSRKGAANTPFQTLDGTLTSICYSWGSANQRWMWGSRGRLGLPLPRILWACKGPQAQKTLRGHTSPFLDWGRQTELPIPQNSQSVPGMSTVSFFSKVSLLF